MSENEFKKNIALIGDERNCRHFYLQFRTILNIKYFFCSNMNSEYSSHGMFFENRKDIECIPLKSSLIKAENLLLILCIDHFARKSYDTLLFNKGLEWGKDYIDSLYVIQYYRYKYSISLEEKNIWIFGAGNNGRCFYKIYKEMNSICGFISNFDEEKECEGLPVIRTDDILKHRNTYVIICSDADVVMAEQLERLGLRGNKDYCFIENIPKKLFVAIGTCQIVNTMEALMKNDSFMKQYTINIYFDNVYEPCSDADNRRMKEYGKFSNVVFYNFANTETVEFRSYEFIINQFYQNAIRLFMPFYYFRGQIMQSTSAVNPYALRSYDGEQFWFRGDQEINHMLENGYTEEEILENILSDDYWSEQEIKENFKRELKRVEILDRFSSFPIQQFIKENYQKISIFNDGTHFSCYLCLYIANEIAKKLHLPLIDKWEMINEENMRLSAMPIYPCVKRVLNIKTKDKYPFCNIERKIVEYIDLEEFARRYIHYVINVRNIYKKIGTFWK